MVQFHRFSASESSTGGFVLHKVPVGNGVYSAWFDASGNLLDCEIKLHTGRTASVLNDHRHVRAELVRVGARYVSA